MESGLHGSVQWKLLKEGEGNHLSCTFDPSIPLVLQLVLADRDLVCGHVCCSRLVGFRRRAFERSPGELFEPTV